MTGSNMFSAQPMHTAFAAIAQPSITDDRRVGSRIVRPAVAAVCRLFDAIAGFAESFRRSQAFSSTYRALAALDDRTLSDIGLKRSELAAVAAHCVDNPDTDYRKTAF